MTSRWSGSSVCAGTVVHRRASDPPTEFRYRMGTLLLDVDEFDRQRTAGRWLLGARHRPLTVRAHDHLRTETGDTLRARVLACLERHGIEPARVGAVRLHTGPRMFGYGFNPVSLWLCDDVDGEPLAAIADVNNTYGESHPYVVTRDEQEAASLHRGDWRAERAKQFHVSPFLELEMTYRLRIVWPAAAAGRTGRVVFDVEVLRDGVEVFRGTHVATAVPLTGSSLLRWALRFAGMPQRTTLLIHWQALRLWRRGARFRRKPPWTPRVGSTTIHDHDHEERVA